MKKTAWGYYSSAADDEIVSRLVHLIALPPLYCCSLRSQYRANHKVRPGHDLIDPPRESQRLPAHLVPPARPRQCRKG
jgi:hypothetical protein